MALREITLRINGNVYTGRPEPRKTLADFIREDCALTGTHLGCEHGVCGACTILMNGEAVRSCLLFAVQADGADLMTVEGLADGVGRLHPIQEAYWQHHALQCGFCTPGFLMTTLAFLRDNPKPTEQEIREGLAGNLCRCTGYQNIVKAVAAAAEMLTTGTYPDSSPPQARPVPGVKGSPPEGSGPGTAPKARRARLRAGTKAQRIRGSRTRKSGSRRPRRPAR
jgi:carbon-monoxide dehydrogenase small subunit